MSLRVSLSITEDYKKSPAGNLRFFLSTTLVYAKAHLDVPWQSTNGAMALPQVWPFLQQLVFRITQPLDIDVPCSHPG